MEEIEKCSTVQRRMKGSSSKTSITFPSHVKFYHKGMGGVNLMNQKTAAYQIDCRSKCVFYLRIFFDLMDVALVSSHVYEKLNYNFKLLDFKTVIANSRIGKYSYRQRAFPQSRPTKVYQSSWSCRYT